MTAASAVDVVRDPTGVERDAVVSVRGLTMGYGGTPVLAGVDLDVQRGEVCALVGPNGAGKSTTVEILEGYRSRHGGDVTVLGVDPQHPTRAWRSRIGIVLQTCDMPPDLTAGELVERFAGFYPHPRPVDETLGLVGLQDRGASRAGTLSGGQRRRLDMAMALVGDPELLFLDEPTTGFDPSARQQAWSVIARLRELGTTILLTTHSMEEAEALADRVVVLVAGRVVADATPATLGGREQADAVVRFRLPSGTSVTELPAFDLAQAVIDRDHVVVTPAGQDDVRRLLDWAHDRHVTLVGLTVQRPTLEETYLALTGGVR